MQLRTFSQHLYSMAAVFQWRKNLQCMQYYDRISEEVRSGLCTCAGGELWSCTRGSSHIGEQHDWQQVCCRRSCTWAEPWCLWDLRVRTSVWLPSELLPYFLTTTHRRANYGPQGKNWDSPRAGWQNHTVSYSSRAASRPSVSKEVNAEFQI